MRADTRRDAVLRVLAARQVFVERRARRHAGLLQLDDHRGQDYFKSSAMVANCSNAASRSAAMSVAMTSGAGKFAESSNASSFSQKMSRFTLSRLISSS